MVGELNPDFVAALAKIMDIEYQGMSQNMRTRPRC